MNKFYKKNFYEQVEHKPPVCLVIYPTISLLTRDQSQKSMTGIIKLELGLKRMSRFLFKTSVRLGTKNLSFNIL